MAEKLSGIQRLTLRAMLDLHPDKHGWLRPQMVASRSGHPVNGLSRTIASLAGRGLVERGRGNGKVVYRLTETGVKTARDLL